MRVPWFIFIPVLLLSVGITWSWRTKDMNFFPEEETAEVEAQVIEPSGELLGPPKPKPVEIEGEPEYVVLGLSAYRELQHDEETLQRLFAILKADGHDEKAYLVGERLIESKVLPIKVKSQIAKKMALLLKDIDPWVFDLNEMTIITVTINGASADESQRGSLTQDLTEILEVSSGGYVAPKVSFNEAGASTLTITLGSLSLEEKIESSESLVNITAGIYRALNSQLKESDSEILLPYWHTPTFDEIKVGFTRYAWKLLIDSSIPEVQEEPITTESE